MPGSKPADSAASQRDREAALEAFAARVTESAATLSGLASDSRNRADLTEVVEAAFLTHDRGTVELTLNEVERVARRIFELQEIVRQNALIQNPDEAAMLQAESEILP